ncbi:GH18382 [Drosophila grimshawi]|uniref:GH18382 n=2 Tax=Drosophila grimshawi TaxID=7222 RepID=B4JEU9_DROGR|nr:GH18382 [Drosophila grimshawi]
MTQCPRCMDRLILHEDIMPVFCDGPNPEPADGNVIAQPGNVPRPSGIYLSPGGFPNWFEVRSFEDVAYFEGGKRSILLTLKRMNSDFPKLSKVISFLLGLQVGSVFVMFFLWLYMQSL